MSVQDNIKVAQGFFDAFNSRDMSKWTLRQADNFISEGPIAPGPMTAAQQNAGFQVMLTASADAKYEVLLTIAQGDYVVINWKYAGTHTGPLQMAPGRSIPPTGKKFSMMGSMTALVQNGKVVHTWFFYDMASLFGQLGLLPPM
jgi:predicted ester cyclase